MNEAKINEYVGKELLTVIDLDTTSEIIKNELNSITKDNYEAINFAKVLLFEGNKALIFVSYDSDGYRDGNWHLINVKNLLDRGATTGIKSINSVVKMIKFETANDNDQVIIITDEYLIRMGQDNTDSYYPRNFFNIEDYKKEANIGEGLELIK